MGKRRQYPSDGRVARPQVKSDPHFAREIERGEGILFSARIKF
jgi:hypothetical protein